MNRFVFVSKSSVYLLPTLIGLSGLMFLLVMELYDSASANPTPLFSVSKVLISFGVVMSMFGLLLENSTICPIDVYFRGSDHVEFKNFVLVSFAKSSITILGVIGFLTGFYLEPDTPYEEKNVGYYFSVIFGGLIGLGLLSQMIIAIRNLFWNRGDYIRLSANTVKWYDNDVKVLKELQIADIIFFIKKFEVMEKSPSLEEIHLHLTNDKVEIISLKTMSLIPQGEIITSELKKVIAEGEGDSKLVN
jgi:hypothetical protein